jgi:hypothetical protein
MWVDAALFARLHCSCPLGLTARREPETDTVRQLFAASANSPSGEALEDEAGSRFIE